MLNAQDTPSLVDSNLRVRTVVENLDQPTSTAFLGPNDFFVLEKATGQVKRVVNGVVQSTVLDLAVNSGSERGLLGIALHPNFPATPHVYLYWTESTTGADTTVLSETPLLGNRVDRFVWDGSTLTFDRNIIRLRALQPPFAAEPTPAAGRGNHDGGVIKFGPDGKLYIFIGDVGRRGWMQNLLNGPYQPGDPLFGTDDNFGGPEPDDAHLTGVILRLNDDGTAPADNPFTEIGHVFVARLEGGQEVPANASTAKGYAAFFLDRAMTSLSFTVTVTGLDFTGTQTADPGDDLLAAHIHAPAPRGTNAGVRFGFFGTPFNDTNPNDVVVTPFASGVGGTIFSKWDLDRGQQHHPCRPAAEHPRWPVVHQLPHPPAARRRDPRADRGEPPGHRQHPQGVLLRPPQQLRLRLRPEVRQPLAGGERRRHVHRAEPGPAGDERRLDPGHGAARADRSVQSRSRRRCSAATSSRRVGRRRTSPTRPRRRWRGW